MKNIKSMNKNALQSVAMTEDNPKYARAIHRNKEIYTRQFDVRSPFERDYTRILYSDAYKRLKHKTQVFFSPTHDHICTRLEHVALVESVSFSIASYLGLNVELTKAIAIGHDLGHTPFGHGGEKILNKISLENGCRPFFHEKNSLYIVDQFETLSDDNYCQHNLNLCYGVRDGIISHCGEARQGAIKPREEYIDLNDIKVAGKYNPYTWEGCVVKISDKIAYLGRDIEDALRLNIITKQQIEELKDKINQIEGIHLESIHNGTLLNTFIIDICEHSSIEHGICMSEHCSTMMDLIMKFNYQNIYLIKRLQVYHDYVNLVLNTLFNMLSSFKQDSINQQENILNVLKNKQSQYPLLAKQFLDWIKKYAKIDGYQRDGSYQNDYIYHFDPSLNEYNQAIIDFLSCVSDRFMVSLFNDIISF